MKNFAGKGRPEKKTWGILGKIEEFYSPEQFVNKGRIVPLNSNPLEAWDSTRSRYRRRPQMPPMPNDGQQGGVVSQGTPSPTPTPLPETPALWYDSTNLGSIDYITSGGTDYVHTWRSIGTYQKTLTGTTVGFLPQWSGSSEMPGSPLIVRFTRTINGQSDFLNQLHDPVVIPHSGTTWFIVENKSQTANYSGTSLTTGFRSLISIGYGNTINGIGSNPVRSVQNFYKIPTNVPNIININNIQLGVTNTTTIPSFSGYGIEDKFLQTIQFPNNSGYTSWSINESSGTGTTLFSGYSLAEFNQVTIGAMFPTSPGIINGVNMDSEVGEIMVFNRVLSPSEITQVQNYLKTKWRYDEWDVQSIALLTQDGFEFVLQNNDILTLQ